MKLWTVCHCFAREIGSESKRVPVTKKIDKSLAGKSWGITKLKAKGVTS